jgi:hypothetical protein
MMALVKRIMIQADEELLARTRAVAAERGVSIAQVVRDALEQEVGRGGRPRTKLIGAFRSGRGDLGRRSARVTRVPPPPWR